MDKLKVSVLVPAYNEEANVVAAHRAITDVFRSVPDYEYEIIFTDNHSTDNTFALLEGLAKSDQRVRVIRFSRNVGYERSLLKAYKAANGDCAVQIDCDLQDPPSLIPKMLALWQEGHEVVYGIRRGLTDGRLTRLARRLFYKLIRVVSTDDLPVNVGEFRLVDRKILNILQQINDTAPYLRGLISAMGFSQVGFEYDRQARTAGASKFPLKAMVSLAVDGLLNHSLIPLRLASLASFLVGACTLVLFAGYLVGKLFFSQDWPAGFATTTVLILVSIMLNAMFLGIVGEYIGRIFMQTKGWPVTIVEKTLNDDIRLVHPSPAKRETS